jgi:hypothetical protein
LEGYIALWRRLQNHFLWREHRTFSKAEAWIDILWEAQHSEEPREVILGSVILIQNYAECLKSLDTWATRWNWHKSKVRRFLKLLQKENMIRFKSESITTRLFVVNYANYDPKRNAVETQLTRKRHGVDTELTPNNKGKNVNNEKKTLSPAYSESFLKFWKEYPSSSRTDKKGCWRKWQKEKLDDRIDEIMSGLENHKKSQRWSDGQYIPNSTTWLNQERWEQTLPVYKSKQPLHPLRGEQGLLTPEEQAEAERDD